MLSRGNTSVSGEMRSREDCLLGAPPHDSVQSITSDPFARSPKSWEPSGA